MKQLAGRAARAHALQERNGQHFLARNLSDLIVARPSRQSLPVPNQTRFLKPILFLKQVDKVNIVKVVLVIPSSNQEVAADHAGGMAPAGVGHVAEFAGLDEFVDGVDHQKVVDVGAEPAAEDVDAALVVVGGVAPPGDQRVPGACQAHLFPGQIRRPTLQRRPEVDLEYIPQRDILAKTAPNHKEVIAHPAAAVEPPGTGSLAPGLAFFPGGGIDIELPEVVQVPIRFPSEHE